MRSMKCVTLLAILGLLGCGNQRAGQTGGPKSAPEKPKARARVGVYDSRAIVVAAVGKDKAFEKWLHRLMAEHKKAEAEGNLKRVEELEAEAMARQKLLHKQGFSTAPVDDILENIKDSFLKIKRKAGVDVIVSKWDKNALAKHKSAELVDVTMMLVDAFDPNERQRKGAIDIQKHTPLSLEQAGKIED